MTRLFSPGLPLYVQQSTHGNVIWFRLYGRRYCVEQVIQRWEVDTDWWVATGRIWRAYWALITQDGMLCVVYQDLEREEWGLEKIYD